MVLLSLITLGLLYVIIANTTMNFVAMLIGKRDLVGKVYSTLPSWHYYVVLIPNLCHIILLGIAVIFGKDIYKTTTRAETLFAGGALIKIDVHIPAYLLLVLSFVTKFKA
ncbi:hypothetical protein [Staphylococcus phage vB_SauH_DELF3]|nr:hypothetical protein [Staphylococcus phage vB_SauH_DELF3]